MVNEAVLDQVGLLHRGDGWRSLESNWLPLVNQELRQRIGDRFEIQTDKVGQMVMYEPVKGVVLFGVGEAKRPDLEMVLEELRQSDGTEVVGLGLRTSGSGIGTERSGWVVSGIKQFGGGLRVGLGWSVSSGGETGATNVGRFSIPIGRQRDGGDGKPKWNATEVSIKPDKQVVAVRIDGLMEKGGGEQLRGMAMVVERPGAEATNSGGSGLVG